MKRTTKKLSLSAETVRHLQANELSSAAGGLPKLTKTGCTWLTCEIIQCLPNTDWSVCDLC
jgi:hypothetical protein